MRGFSAIRGLGERFSRARSGSTAIEFAMVIGPFLALLFAIIETALIYFAEFSMDAAVQNASRAIYTGNSQNANVSAAQFKQSVCRNLPAFMNCDQVVVDVRCFNTFGAAAQNMPKMIGSNGMLSASNSTFHMGGPSQVVVVGAYYDWRLIGTLPALGDFTGKVGLSLANMPDGGRLISAITAFRSQPFPGPATPATC